MKVSKHNYIPDIKFLSSPVNHEYLVFQGFRPAILSAKRVELVTLYPEFSSNN